MRVMGVMCVMCVRACVYVCVMHEKIVTYVCDARDMRMYVWVVCVWYARTRSAYDHECGYMCDVCVM